MPEKQQETQAISTSSGGGGTPSQLREHLYRTEEIVPWGDGLLTVNGANDLFQAYFAEGNEEKANSLQTLIATAKSQIREANPDE